MATITLTDSKQRAYTLTTEHPASSYGQPVLVDPDGKAHGPQDRIQAAAGDWMTADQLLTHCLFLTDPADQDNALIRKWNQLATLTR